MSPNVKFKIFLSALFISGIILCLQMPAFAGVNASDFIENLDIKGDLRVRYDWQDNDDGKDDAKDRIRGRLRLGLVWHNPDENWKVAAGLATGGLTGNTTNSTYSNEQIFETGDIRLDYAYAEHKIDNFRFLAGQQKNPYYSTMALWDGDVRPAGFTGQIQLAPMFFTAGYYQVRYIDRDIARMLAAQAGVKVGNVLVAVAYYTYFERKVIAYMHVRIGPNRVGFFGRSLWGLGQPIADAVKLMFKEIIIPTRADKRLFLLAPMLSMASALAAWAVIPFDAELVLADVDASLLYVLAITSIGVYGVLMAGWASNSKYALLGAIRSAAQIVSYEIAMGFALVGVLIAAGSINLGDIVVAQRGGFHHWYWLPLFPLFLIYFISAVAETNRAPFDVAEGESEIVAGFHVDYSGMAFAVFFLAEYSNMILVSLLTSLMFLGGWLSPLDGIGLFEGTFLAAPSILWLLAKTLIFMFLLLWFRATFPRYRYDQIMRLGWKVFIPITIVWLLVVALVVVMDWDLWAMLGELFDMGGR